MNTPTSPQSRENHPFVGPPRSLTILDQQVQYQQCAIGWSNMAPVEGGRFCKDCKITVERAEQYTSEELKAIVNDSTGPHRCFRVTTLHNGQILTRDTPLLTLVQEVRFRMTVAARRVLGRFWRPLKEQRRE